MTELNMQTVRDTVIDYVSDGNTVPDGMSAEAYTEAQYDMDTLCDELYEACEAAGCGPDELDPDEFVGLLEKHDTGSVVTVDMIMTENARRFGFGVSARKTVTINKATYYKDTDAYVRLNLYINEAVYGKPGVMLDIRLSNLADVFTDDPDLNNEFREAKAKGDNEQFHSVLCVGDDFIDLSDVCSDFDEIDEPEIDVPWYHDGKRDLVTIPIEIVKDNRI